MKHLGATAHAQRLGQELAKEALARAGRGREARGIGLDVGDEPREFRPRRFCLRRRQAADLTLAPEPLPASMVTSRPAAL